MNFKPLFLLLSALLLVSLHLSLDQPPIKRINVINVNNEHDTDVCVFTTLYIHSVNINIILAGSVSGSRCWFTDTLLWFTGTPEYTGVIVDVISNTFAFPTMKGGNVC